MTPFLRGTIEGAGYAKPATDPPKEVSFEVQLLPWSGAGTAASCQVRLVQAGVVLINHPIHGVDPFQALELSMKLVGSQVSL